MLQEAELLKVEEMKPRNKNKLLLEREDQDCEHVKWFSWSSIEAGVRVRDRKHRDRQHWLVCLHPLRAYFSLYT